MSAENVILSQLSNPCSYLRESALGKPSLSVYESRENLYETINRLPLLLPYFKRNEVRNVDGLIEIVMTRSGPEIEGKSPEIIDRYLKTPKDDIGVLFYAEPSFRGQFLAAIGTFIETNPSHNIYFLDGIGDNTLNTKLKALGIEIFDPLAVEREKGLDFSSSTENQVCLSVTRKVLCHLMFVEGTHCQSCRGILVSDSDILFNDDISGAFEQVFEHGCEMGACTDCLPTRTPADVPHRDAFNKQNRTSVGGFLDIYFPHDRSALEYFFGLVLPKSIDWDTTPYFNAGLLYLRKSKRLAYLMRKVLETIQRNQEFYNYLPWKEQTMINILYPIYEVPVCLLEPSVWNFWSERSKVMHLTGSRGPRLFRYDKHREQVDRAWSIFGESHWPVDEGVELSV